jgi:dipeptidyl aminopeptidase/acylaminoacyl peptidase
LPNSEYSWSCIAVATLFAFTLSACERSATHPALAQTELPELLSAHEFVFNRDGYSGFSFSPDGKRLRWSAPSGWRRALHVRTEDTGKVHVYRVGGSGMYWSVDSRRLLILNDPSGEENHHLYRLDIDDPNATPVDLTPFRGVKVWLYQLLDDDPEHVLVLHNRRDRTLRDLYRINLASGAETLIAQNPGDGVAPVVDATGKVLGWRKSASADRPRLKPRPPELAQRSALSKQSEEVTRPLRIAPDKTEAWLLSNRGRDRTALLHFDGKAGKVATVHEDAEADIERVLMSGVTGKPLLVTVTGSYPKTTLLDAELKADVEPLLARFEPERIGFDIVSMDPKERRVVMVIVTRAGRHYYLLDRDRKQHALLGKTRNARFEQAMIEPQAVSIRARDGLTLPAYVLRPNVDKPLPLVLLVHGGPWQRVTWGDPDGNEDILRAQFLANRGYAVLAVNFRGSTGYGRGFKTAAVGEFGAKMQDDLNDAVQWAIDQGIADPARVAVMGHSYGGYASLMALATQPKTFACGFSINGPADLAPLIEEFPSYWELELSHWYAYVGDPAVPVDRERMQKVSPVNLARYFERPVLIVQGTKDVRVRPSQSQAMVRALRSANKDVRYIELDDLGHSLGYWAHHLLVLRQAEKFFAECLGGRAARFDTMEWVARLTGRLPLSGY